MMRRWRPRSLLGQMLWSVALALLVAQVLPVFFLYRAEQQRREAGLVNALAFQLVAGPTYREGPPRFGGQERREHRRQRIEHALESPLLQGDTRDVVREARLRKVLIEQGVIIGELVVLSRPASNDRWMARMGGDRGPTGSRRGEGEQANGEILLAGLKRAGDDRWLIARAPYRAVEPRYLGGTVLQTLVLYLVIVGGLALLLQRITRPLATLTARVESFGASREPREPLALAGPQDTRRLIAAHNAMEARIAALLDEKDVMLGAIGHDLKTPLAALRVRIESVEDDIERGRMAAVIEDITTSLDDILSLARVGRPSDPLERTELSALVASVVEEYEDMGKEVLLGDTQRMAMRLRATWLRRALRNLVGNALRYGERARVSVRREGSDAIIRIEDDGPGIPEGDIAAMLEPFKRGETSRNRETGGAGLGLTLARAIAEQHGGALLLTNRRDNAGQIQGLVAELRLPLD